MRSFLPILLATLLLTAFRGLSEGADRVPFDMTGQIVLISDGVTRQILLNHDGKRTALWISDRIKTDFRSGDMVRAVGYTDPNARNFPKAFATSLEVLGHRPMPQTTPLRWRDAADQPFGSPVSVRCVIMSAFRDDLDSQWNWIVFRTEDGKGHAVITENEYPVKELQKLRDAEVSLSGFLSPTLHWRRFIGPSVMLFGQECLQILRPPAPKPFDAPPMSEKSSPHRQRINGTVIGIGRNRIFLRTDDNTIITVYMIADTPFPRIGSRVTSVGFVEADHCDFCLKESLVREVSAPPEAIAPAETIDPKALFTNESGHDIANFSYYGKIVRLVGTVINSAEDIRKTGLIALHVAAHTVCVDATVVRDALPSDFGPGYEISVAGVCAAEFDNNPSRIFPGFGGFTIYPRVPEDLTILRRPPWWTPVRLMVVIGILLAVIVVILVWNRALKVLSERRGRELAREQLHHATSELKVEERTRLAVELHDSISQTLTGVALQIDAAQGSAESPSVAGRFLDTARAMLASCRQELRCCIWDLKSRTFDENDMTEAVTRTLAPHLGDVEAQVRFNVPRSILSESATHDILRIIRELAVNAIRHGQAKRLRIAGEYRDGMVRFSVRDDGTGFDPQDVPGPAQGHFGLQGIRERISGRNGEITVESSPDKGTKVTVAFAADERDEDEP